MKIYRKICFIEFKNIRMQNVFGGQIMIKMTFSLKIGSVTIKLWQFKIGQTADLAKELIKS